MEVAKDFQLGSSKEGRRKLTMITRRFHALLSKKRHIVGGVIGICIVAATLLALLVVGANPGCSGRWGCASPRAANNMRLSALARLSEAIYEVAWPTLFIKLELQIFAILVQKGLGCPSLQDVQSRLDEEIDALDANAFMDSEALKAQRERMNLKYMCVCQYSASSLSSHLFVQRPDLSCGHRLGDYFPRTNLKYMCVLLVLRSIAILPPLSAANLTLSAVTAGTTSPPPTPAPSRRRSAPPLGLATAASGCAACAPCCRSGRAWCTPSGKTSSHSMPSLARLPSVCYLLYVSACEQVSPTPDMAWHSAS